MVRFSKNKLCLLFYTCHKVKVRQAKNFCTLAWTRFDGTITTVFWKAGFISTCMQLFCLYVRVAARRNYVSILCLRVFDFLVFVPQGHDILQHLYARGIKNSDFFMI